ncbi:MAG: tryptophan--tRNA ligase [Xanthomonadales bacterium]|nr:tryptophan--tRNA ligase [Xanthomonadales bacterium]
MAKRSVLTGITTTGSPHLGNYVGAIRPAIAASRQPDRESFFFLADLHALIKCQAPERVHRSTLEIAASWLAAGLDPAQVHFYRQSDIPEIPELTWILGCVAAKGLLNRAHAYKAAVDANREQGLDPDAGVTMGLYSYPVLMAADILAFGAHEVPVGRDQVQHIEMARDMAQRLNHLYGEDLLVLPEAVVDDEVATLPGLDGRKMSKSYDNTIPLWLSSKALRKAVAGIVTNSLEPGQPKDPDEAQLFQIYRAFATAEESRALADELRGGLGWGEAKTRLVDCLEQALGPARERYETLIATPERIEELLQEGATRARQLAAQRLRRVREAVGLRPLQRSAGKATPEARSDKPPRILSFQENGRFQFKLVDGDGSVLLLSPGMDNPAQNGQAIRQLRQEGADPVVWRVRPDGRWELPGTDGQVLACSCDAGDEALGLITAALTRLNG